MSLMPASRVRARGFTLVELLVVLMIVGIAIAMASLSVGGRDNATLAEEEAEEFMVSARFVSEQTVLNREVIGLFWQPRADSGTTGQRWCYQWRRYRDQRWEEVTDFMEERCLPPELQLDIQVEGEEWEYDPRETTPQPVLAFYPSGEATPYEMAIIPGRFDEGETQRIEITMMADLVWVNRDREEELQDEW